MTKRYTNSVLL